MTNYRTEENISMITTSFANVIIVSLFISFIFTSLYFLIFISLQIAIDLRILIVGIVIFSVYFISNLFIRTEFFIAVKKDYKIRPPLQILIISVSAYIALFFIIPDRFMESDKVSLPVFVLLTIPSGVIGMVSQKVLYHSFIILIKFFSKIFSKDILGNDAFYENIEFKYHEFLRHGGIFSIILISFTIPKYAASKLKRSLIFTLFFDILRKNIRKTDFLGILENGKTAAILSNGNNAEKAYVQAKRLVNTLKDNQLLMKKLHVYNSIIKSSIIQASKEHESFEKLMENVFAVLHKILQNKKIEIEIEIAK
ncbi:MAG: hypothetical protein JXB88_09025 [Spirochaetales bacterium]|nr:hypothetical protein [Spirochaetales bacterium]